MTVAHVLGALNEAAAIWCGWELGKALKQGRDRDALLAMGLLLANIACAANLLP